MIQFFGHPFAAYCWKALIALYENDTPFQFRILDPEHEENNAEFARLWPIKRFPLLVDHGQVVFEATIVIEYLQHFHPGPVKLIPGDPAQALEVRKLDRVFDNYVATPMTKPVFDTLRPEEARDAYGVTEAHAMLDTIYAWLNTQLDGREWAAGKEFSLADCAAAPALFYADWVHPMSDDYPVLKDYRARLLARPSVARVVDEARPYRSFFPLGAPDRD